MSIYQTLSESVLNALRRRLPITKVKFDWDNKASVHKLASELNAAKLILLGNAPGIMNESEQLVRELTTEQARTMLAARQRVSAIDASDTNIPPKCNLK